MKIERINENQLKIILTRADLDERNLNINELAYNNEKMQHLFREMMEQALIEHSFRPENNSSLMIEAALLSSDSVMIIVTKVTAGDDSTPPISLIPKARDERLFKKRPIVDPSVQAPPRGKGIGIFCFACLDDVANAAKRLQDRVSEDNELYKLNDRYYLVARSGSDLYMSEEHMDYVLSDYAQKAMSNDVAEYYLKERGELLISRNAVGKMAKL